jgi:hypothetical protein
MEIIDKNIIIKNSKIKSITYSHLILNDIDINSNEKYYVDFPINCSRKIKKINYVWFKIFYDIVGHQFSVLTNDLLNEPSGNTIFLWGINQNPLYFVQWKIFGHSGSIQKII